MEKQEKLFNRNFVLLLICGFLAFTAYQGYFPVFPLYVLDNGGNNALVGTMGTALSISSIASRLVCGYLQDRYGRKVILLAGILSFTLNLLAYALITDMTSIFLLRITTGVAQGMFFGAAGTLVSDVVPKKYLVEGLSFYGMSYSVAGIFAPSIGSFLYDELGAAPLFFIMSALAAVSIGGFLLIKVERPVREKKQSEQKEKQPISVSAFFDLTVIMPSMVSFFLFFAYSAVSNFLTAYGKELGIGGVSLFYSTYGIANMMLRLGAGPLTRALGQGKIIVYSMLAMILAYLTIAMGGGIGMILFAGALCGVAWALSGPMINAMVFKLVPDSRKGVANSTYAIMGDLGSAIGAAVWGLLAQGFTYQIMYMGAAVSMIPALLLYFRKIKPDERLK